MAHSEFFFSYTGCLIKDREPSLSYYLPVVGGRSGGFMPFPRALAISEVQTASSRP